MTFSTLFWRQTLQRWWPPALHGSTHCPMALGRIIFNFQRSIIQFQSRWRREGKFWRNCPSHCRAIWPVKLFLAWAPATISCCMKEESIWMSWPTKQTLEEGLCTGDLGMLNSQMLLWSCSLETKCSLIWELRGYYGLELIVTADWITNWL